MVSTRLREIARETMAIIDDGAYQPRTGQSVRISERVKAAAAGTRLYLPGQDIALPAVSADAGPPAIEVTNETSLAAARRLGEGVAALVFASARNPGGGFLSGAEAQEESIARSSALYPCQQAAPEFYEFHRRERDLRYSDRVIYCPAVPVFRADDGSLLEAPYEVAFLTAAAPNLGAIAANQPDAAPSVPGVLARRARRVLEVAAAHGHRRLVLGAWGCGVFRNDPAAVAATFAGELARVPGWFDQVTFAVLDHQRGAPTFSAFARALLPRRAPGG